MATSFIMQHEGTIESSPFTGTIRIGTVADGDTLLCFIIHANNPTTASPTGWTKITSGVGGFYSPLGSPYGCEVWRRVASGDSASTHVWTFATNDFPRLAISYMVFRGLDNGAPPYGASSSDSANNGSGGETYPFFPPTIANDQDVWIGISNPVATSTLTYPGGLTAPRAPWASSGSNLDMIYRIGPAGSTGEQDVTGDIPHSSGGQMAFGFALSTPTRTGSLSSTLGAMTVVATGTVATAGVLAKTLGALTLVGTVVRGNDLAKTLAPATVAATGTVAIAGTAAITLGAVTVVPSAGVAITGTLSRTLGALFSAPVLTASGVWASATHRVRVVLTAEPKHADMFDPGDAMNPRTWAVTRLDTGDSVPVIAAVMASDDATNHTVDLTLLEPLATHLITHRLDVTGLLTLGGAPMSGPTAFTFLGLVQTMDPVELATVDVFRDRDLANPPFQIDRGIGYSGTIVIGADGDYDTDAGEPLLRKLVMRRMGTRRGTIRHLPNYGLGLIEKEPIGAGGDVVRLRTEIEDQTMQEPDVVSAQARLSMSRTGVLVVQLFVRGKNGLSLNIRMGAAGGRLVEL